MKLFVCKYVITPGEGERLQTLISVSFNAADAPAVGAFFNDQQGRSFVLALDEGQDEPPLSACPAPTTTTTTEAETTTTEGETTTTEGETTTTEGEGETTTTEGATVTTAGGPTTAPRVVVVTQAPAAPAPPAKGSLPTTGPVSDGAVVGGMVALAAGILALLISRRRTV